MVRDPGTGRLFVAGDDEVVTADREVLAAAAEAVQAGRATSVSAWVNRAMAEKAARDVRHHALGDAIAAHEAEFGPISDQEMEAVESADAAVEVRIGAPRRGPA